MGVLGLWQLLAPVGQPVTLESLENKIFAVDISIWLNQAVKGYRDSTGGSVPNAHLLSLFSRLCKLLFYKIRPIIVFDGGFPELKRQTIINRQQRRAAVKQVSKDVGLKILTNYLASQQLGQTSEISNIKKVSFKAKEKAREEIFKLSPLPESSQSILSDSTETNDDFERKFMNFSREDIKYLNKIDIESDDFNALPPDVKQEILSTLKEVRKHRTWDQYEELPKESNEFSHYQMQCLLKKRKLQSKLEEVQKDIRKINSSAYVSQYTNDHVIGETNKIMSDDTSYYVLLKKIIEYKDNVSNKNSSEDIKPSTSIMADAKSAFIRDIENIDLDEDYYSCDSNFNLKEEKTDLNIKTKLVSSDEELSYKKPFKKEDNEICTEIKIEKNSLNLSEEEYDIDNPPSSESINDFKKEITCTNLENDKILAFHSKTEECINTNQTLVYESEIQLTTNADIENVQEKESRYDKQPNQLPSEEEMLVVMDQPTTSKTASEVTHHNKNIANDNLHTKHYSQSSQNGKENKSENFETSADSHLSKFQNEPMAENDQNYNLPSPSAENSKSNLNSELSDTPMNADETINDANLELQRELDVATSILEAEQAKQDRQANTVQDHMIEECKELLRLFGIPYIVSPLEAEAQCAFYDIVDFSHGTITDDSDVWLFGGKRVYKNFFTQQKFVESYKDKDIFNHFGLSRKKLINFALLTGSDYTEGIEGVGPVTAMEIISEFPGENMDALELFKEWWLESNKSAKPPENKVRTKLQKLALPQSFPDEKVFDAYLNPEVDTSMEKFTWGRPDLDALRDYTKERFGWRQSKVDDALLPVLKKLNERDKQTHLDSFFTVTLRKETNLFPSKRIMSALKKITSPQKLKTGENEKSSASKQKSKKSERKKVPKKAVSVRGKGKKSQVQEPVLSEESSSDSDSLQKLATERANALKRKSKSFENKPVPSKIIRKTASKGRSKNSQIQGPLLSETSSSDLDS